MATQQAKSKLDYAPPPIEGDFYRIAAVLSDGERALFKRVREFAEGVVAPVLENRDYCGPPPLLSSRRTTARTKEQPLLRTFAM
jgi:hypothetical protein